MTPEHLDAIRGRDARARVVNGIGSPITATQDRRDLLAEVDRLAKEVHQWFVLYTQADQEGYRLNQQVGAVRDAWAEFADDISAALGIDRGVVEERNHASECDPWFGTCAVCGKKGRGDAYRDGDGNPYSPDPASGAT